MMHCFVRGLVLALVAGAIAPIEGFAVEECAGARGEVRLHHRGGAAASHRGTFDEVSTVVTAYREWHKRGRKAPHGGTFTLTQPNGAQEKVAVKFPKLVAMTYEAICRADPPGNSRTRRFTVRLRGGHARTFVAHPHAPAHLVDEFRKWSKGYGQDRWFWAFSRVEGSDSVKMGIVMDFRDVASLTLHRRRTGCPDREVRPPRGKGPGY